MSWTRQRVNPLFGDCDKIFMHSLALIKEALQIAIQWLYREVPIFPFKSEIDNFSLKKSEKNGANYPLQVTF